MSTSPIVILLTVNDHETHAVLDAFCGIDGIPKSETRGGITYNLLGEHGGMQIVHTISEMGGGGVGAAQQRTRQAIQHWAPQAIVAVGIAFGLDESKQRIGDVLVSDQLQDYDLDRRNADGTVTPRGDKLSASDPLINRLRQADHIQKRQKNMNWPVIRPGLVLSGQKLIDNFDYRESLKKLFGEAIGGEMEGTGLYVSATEFKKDWVIVKAICDWGYNKNDAEKETNQKLAAKNAAQVIKVALDMGNLYSPHAGEVKLGFEGGHIPVSMSVAPEKANSTEISSLHGGRKLWFNSLFRVDRIAVAAYASAVVHKGEFQVEVVWPSELLKLAEKVSCILDEIQSPNRPAKLNEYDSEKLANFVIDANSDFEGYKKIINNAGKRVALMLDGIIPYYRFPPDDLIGNYLALCVLNAGRHLFRYADFEPYRDSNLLAPWETVADSSRGECLGLLFDCPEEVYAAHLIEVSGYKLDGYDYFYGPKSKVMEIGQYCPASIYNSWFHEWIIPQLELLMTYRQSTEVVHYNENVVVGKIRDANFDQIP